MFHDHTIGERIRITDQAIDGRGDPVTDGLVEIWQADHVGHYPRPGGDGPPSGPRFPGRGRQPTDLDSGEFEFETIKPGRTPFDDGRLQAPHIQFFLVARGMNPGLCTRMYFPEKPPTQGIRCCSQSPTRPGARA